MDLLRPDPIRINAVIVTAPQGVPGDPYHSGLTDYDSRLLLAEAEEEVGH